MSNHSQGVAWPGGSGELRPGSRTASLLSLCFLACCLAASAACHSFAATGPGEVRPGDVIRAEVTGAFSDSLSQVLDGNPRKVEGRVVESLGDGIMVEVPAVRGFRGMQPLNLNQRLRLPYSALVTVESQRLDRFRTGLAVGGGLVGLGVLIAREVLGESGGSQRPRTSGPLERRRGLILFRIGGGRKP